MDTESSIFKFVSIRNASDEVKSDPKFTIQPKTELTDSLVAILAKELEQPEKIKAFNKVIDDFIKSKNFFKTKQELSESVNKNSSLTDDKKNEVEIQSYLNNLFDNIVVRTVTKSNANEIFKILTDSLKEGFLKLKREKIKKSESSKLRIVMPEGLIITFSPPKLDREVAVDANTKADEVAKELSTLLKERERIQSERSENLKLLKAEQHKVYEAQEVIARAQQAEFNESSITKQDPKKDPKNKHTNILKKSETTFKEVSMVELNRLQSFEQSLIQSEELINARLAFLNSQAFKTVPTKKYVRVGENYVGMALTTYQDFINPPKIEEDAIVVYANGCYLNFPFQVADLRVVEQKTVGYLPTEIAHINNTQSGESQTRVTRRLKRIETFESFISEDEVTKETDTQSTEKFSVEKAASDVQSEENSFNINASVSGSYGVVTASVDTGYSNANSSTNSNSSAQSYAKEIVQKVVDRVSKKVKSERSIKSIEEFEETVTHVIDNTKSDAPKSYVYRWLTKLVRATLKNYGKRLIFQFDVPHLSHYYLTRAIKESLPLNIPPDPRLLKKNSQDGEIIAFYDKNPAFPEFLMKGINDINNPNGITRENYQAWAEMYGVELEQPPNKLVRIGKSYHLPIGEKDWNDISYETLTFDSKRYKPKTGYLSIGMSDSGVNSSPRRYISGFLGNQPFITNYTNTIIIDLSNDVTEKDIVPFSFRGYFSAFVMNIEIECELKKEIEIEWQTKCYFAIIEAYENLKAEAENQMSAFNPNNPGINPDRKSDLIRSELKKGALLKMFRCNPFWITDDYEVGKEYDPNCCLDQKNAKQVRFLEDTFDWKNMTYELYPYFYADKDNWSGLLNLTDDDPHFESFLQSSYATVRIPVFRDTEKEKAAINFMLYNSIGNTSVIPDGMQSILDDLSTNTPFGYINETETDIEFVDIKKVYNTAGVVRFFFINDAGEEVLCNEVQEYDIEGNQTFFYYNSTTNKMVISEIKEGINIDGQKYNYYFNSANEKIITHRTRTEYSIDGSKTAYYSTDLGIFNIPTDLVILEAGVQDGVEVRGFPEDATTPLSDVIIPKQYSPAIIQK
jgi:hypothetical protein